MNPATRLNGSELGAKQKPKPSAAPKVTKVAPANHPNVNVGYKNVPPQFKTVKKKPNHKRSAPVCVSDVEAAEVLKRIQNIKSSI
tara:strand:+ start:102 stop:356 length:255 start_codon:yes stop_codon:yes gene_type:complete